MNFKTVSLHVCFAALILFSTNVFAAQTVTCRADEINFSLSSLCGVCGTAACVTAGAGPSVVFSSVGIPLLYGGSGACGVSLGVCDDINCTDASITACCLATVATAGLGITLIAAPPISELGLATMHTSLIYNGAFVTGTLIKFAAKKYFPNPEYNPAPRRLETRLENPSMPVQQSMMNYPETVSQIPSESSGVLIGFADSVTFGNDFSARRGIPDGRRVIFVIVADRARSVSESVSEASRRLSDFESDSTNFNSEVTRARSASEPSRTSSDFVQDAFSTNFDYEGRIARSFSEASRRSSRLSENSVSDLVQIQMQ